MTNDDRAQFLAKIGDIDSQVEDTTFKAEDDPLVTQIGNLTKATLLLTNLLLYQPAPIPTCIMCDRPTDPNVPGDLDLCTNCYNAISAPDPGLDESWGEYLADVVDSLGGAAP